ncbi:MAG: LytTR family DNA-binding domain-containing protein [Bacteroidales bacterium]
MKALIIEDEKFASKRLESLINNFDPSIEIVAKLESVSESIVWFRENKPPDLIFLDIHLEDGLSFTIFEEVKINIPIIFTTAFDEYAIKAFKLKSVDYLLKPINQEELNRAIEKYREWTDESGKMVDIKELMVMIQSGSKQLRERFSVVSGTKLKTVEVSEIAYFFSTSGITFLVTHANKQYSIDISLDNLLNQLDARQFFRINRQFLVSLKSIANVHIFPKSRLKIDLNPAQKDEIFVTIDKVPEFKKWMDGEK